MIAIAAILGVIFLIFIAHYYAKQIEIECPNCGARHYRETGNTKKIERPKNAYYPAMILGYSYEYECLDCNELFWKKLGKFSLTMHK